MHPKHDPAHEWFCLKQRLIEYGIYERGQRKKLALYLKVNQSQITRWLEEPHPREPPYSMGKKIEHYLDSVPFVDE
jgi:hypothetical protein